MLFDSNSALILRKQASLRSKFVGGGGSYFIRVIRRDILENLSGTMPEKKGESYGTLKEWKG
jgi:hypothetical protein